MERRLPGNRLQDFACGIEHRRSRYLWDPYRSAGTYPFTIQVTDADSNTATAQVSITITGKLQGNNAFSFNGFNNGTPFYMAGSFIGDGAGNITSGVLDQNDFTNGVTTNAPFTGTYTIGTNGLGTLSFVIGAPLNVTYNYIMAPSLTGDIKFILADTNHPNIYGSGVIKAQTLSGLTGLANLRVMGHGILWSRSWRQSCLRVPASSRRIPPEI